MAERSRVPVWDLPVRIAHWLFVLLIPLAWWTAEEHLYFWHFRVGYLLLTLLIFRLIWGFIGSSTARFASFLRGPRYAIRYARGLNDGPKRIGHNPLGGWSVAALLTLMLVQVGLGLFATEEDGLEAGPLSDRVSFDAASQMADLHETNFNLLLAFITLHIGAILYYTLFKRENLVGPMLSGQAEAEAGTQPMRPGRRPALLFTLAAALGLVWWVSLGAPF